MKTKYDLRPASAGSEAGLFYAADSESDLANGCIGHVRMDFGRLPHPAYRDERSVQQAHAGQ